MFCKVDCFALRPLFITEKKNSNFISILASILIKMILFVMALAGLAEASTEDDSCSTLKEAIKLPPSEYCFPQQPASCGGVSNSSDESIRLLTAVPLMRHQRYCQQSGDQVKIHIFAETSNFSVNVSAKLYRSGQCYEYYDYNKVVSADQLNVSNEGQWYWYNIKIKFHKRNKSMTLKFGKDRYNETCRTEGDTVKEMTVAVTGGVPWYTGLKKHHCSTLPGSREDPPSVFTRTRPGVTTSPDTNTQKSMEHPEETKSSKLPWLALLVPVLGGVLLYSYCCHKQQQVDIACLTKEMEQEKTTNHNNLTRHESINSIYESVDALKHKPISRHESINSLYKSVDALKHKPISRHESINSLYESVDALKHPPIYRHESINSLYDWSDFNGTSGADKATNCASRDTTTIELSDKL